MRVNFAMVKILEGRILRCLAEATRPISLEELFVDLEQKYHKNYSTGLPRCVFNSTLENMGRNKEDEEPRKRGWLNDPELQLSPAGLEMYHMMYRYKDGPAEKFFRPSNSPNVPVPTQLALPDFSAKATTW